VKDTILSFCRKQTADKISQNRFNARTLVDFVRLTFERNISDRTACAWLDIIGFYRSSKGQGLYFDGHERNDVVEYRKSFVERFELIYFAPNGHV